MKLSRVVSHRCLRAFAFISRGASLAHKKSSTVRKSRDNRLPQTWPPSLVKPSDEETQIRLHEQPYFNLIVCVVEPRQHSEQLLARDLPPSPDCCPYPH